MLLSGADARFAHGRWSSTVLALALIVGQAGMAAHFALVKHAYCAEHGELVEVGAEDAHAASHPPGSLPGFYASDGDGEEHGHEHCVLSGHKRDAVLGKPVGVALQFTVPPASLSPFIGWVPFFSALHRIAPKQSPPLA